MKRSVKLLRFCITMSAVAALTSIDCPSYAAQTDGNKRVAKGQESKLDLANAAASPQLSGTLDTEKRSRSKNQTEVFVPLPASGAREDRLAWSSDLWISNLDSTPANVQFFLYKLNQSNPSPAVYNDTVGAGEIRRYKRAVNALFGEAGASVMRVVSDRRLVVRSSLELVSMAEEDQKKQKMKEQTLPGPLSVGTGDQLRLTATGQPAELEDLLRQFYAAVPASFAIGAAQRTRLLGVYPPDLLSSALPSLPVGLVETTGDPVTARVTAFDEAGNAIASKDYTLAGFEARLHNIGDFISGAGANKRILEVEVVSGLGKLIAFGSALAQDPPSLERMDASKNLEAAADAGGKPGKLGTKLPSSESSSAPEKGLQGGSVNGSGSSGQIALWTDGKTLGNSSISQNGPNGNVFIGPNPTQLEGARLGVDGAGRDVGISATNYQGDVAVKGASTTGKGIVGSSVMETGVTGESSSNEGVLGVSESGRGVHGMSKTLSGVFGESDKLHGVAGLSIRRRIWRARQGGR